MSAPEPPNKSGFVLSGGGAYAAYEVGVMQALTAGLSPATSFTPVDADVLAGTSAGSINAAIVAGAPMGHATATLDYLERVWVRRLADQPGACAGNVLRVRANPLSLLDPACVFDIPDFYVHFAEDLSHIALESLARGDRFVRSEGTLSQRFIEGFDLEALVASAPLRHALGEVVDFEAVVRSPRALRVAATNWRTGGLRVFTNEEMTPDRGVHVLIGSTAIPGVFPSEEIDDDPYVDGGVIMNTPLSPAIKAGASDLHVVYMDPDVTNIPLPRHRNTLNTLYRTLVIGFGVTVNRDIATAAGINRRIRNDAAAALTKAVSGEPRAQAYRPVTIHRYHPSEDLGGAFRWLDFGQNHIIRLIERGYEDARVHDCLANRCLIPGREDLLSSEDTAPWARRDA
jgi:predicted acylesterase/phospholipase RssA